MTFPTSRTTALLLCIAAATILSISKSSRHSSPSLRQQPRRQLSQSLAPFNDPKSVSIREAFSYAFSSPEEKYCVEPQEVEELAKVLRDLYERHGIRVFPRNGFLLGIIRHGGFLPNEKQPDVDLGILSTDVDRVRAEHAANGNKVLTRLSIGEFKLFTKAFDKREDWVSWKGRNPVTGEKYPFFGVRILKPKGTSTTHKHGIRANSIYPYTHRPGTTFFPRLNLARYNHNSHTEEMLRYNSEGADFRLLDTDEKLTAENNVDGLQIGSVFKTDLECMVLKQFYFTMIYVPCDYEAVLTAFYGENWGHVEDRGGGRGSNAAQKLDDEQNRMRLESGPRPLCPYTPSQ